MIFRQKLIEAARTAPSPFKDESIKSYYLFQLITKDSDNARSDYCNVPVSSKKA